VKLANLKWIEKFQGFVRIKILIGWPIWSVDTSNMSGTTHL
jgi:hypothetical protein